ncbi:MAG TPA: hypothetical protein VF691_11515 [Cytophagaceae bacterium]|jgi:hypothetical protein
MNLNFKSLIATLFISYFLIDSSMAKNYSRPNSDFVVLNTKDTIFGKVMTLYTLGISQPYCGKLKFKQDNGEIKILHPIDIKSFSRNGQLYESALIEDKGKDFVFLPLIISGRISYYQVCFNKDLGAGFENGENATAYNAMEYRFYIKKEGGNLESVTKKNFDKIINNYFHDSKYYAFIQNDIKVEYFQISKLVQAYNAEPNNDRQLNRSTANLHHE